MVTEGYLCPMKPSLIQSIAGMRCPRCRSQRMFPTGTFSFTRPFEMDARCRACNQDLAPEPGFYYGAMFLSYILSGFFSIGLVALLHWVLGLGLIVSFLILIAILAVLFVWFFRISRSLWIHINVKYRPGAGPS